MDIKYNEATNNRPEGNRIIDAPFVFIDTAEYYRQLTQEDAWHKNDRNGITLFKGEGQTIVLTAFHAGAELHANEVKGIITIQVMEGLLTFLLGGEEFTLKPGNVVALHPNLKHSLLAKDDSLVMITTNLHNN